MYQQMLVFLFQYRFSVLYQQFHPLRHCVVSLIPQSRIMFNIPKKHSGIFQTLDKFYPFYIIFTITPSPDTVPAYGQQSLLFVTAQCIYTDSSYRRKLTNGHNKLAGHLLTCRNADSELFFR